MGIQKGGYLAGESYGGWNVESYLHPLRPGVEGLYNKKKSILYQKKQEENIYIRRKT